MALIFFPYALSVNHDPSSMITGSIGSFIPWKPRYRIVPFFRLPQLHPTQQTGEKELYRKGKGDGKQREPSLSRFHVRPLHFFIFPSASSTCPPASPASIIWTYAFYISIMYTQKDTLRGPDSAMWTVWNTSRRCSSRKSRRNWCGKTLPKYSGLKPPKGVKA